MTTFDFGSGKVPAHRPTVQRVRKVSPAYHASETNDLPDLNLFRQVSPSEPYKFEPWPFPETDVPAQEESTPPIVSGGGGVTVCNSD